MCVSVSKEKKKEIRERALMKYEEKLCSDSRSKAEKKHAERKYALESMMKVWLNDAHYHICLCCTSQSQVLNYSCESALKSKNDYICDIRYLILKAWKWGKRHYPENEGHRAGENHSGAGSMATEKKETNSSQKSRRKSKQCGDRDRAAGQKDKWRWGWVTSCVTKHVKCSFWFVNDVPLHVQIKAEKKKWKARKNPKTCLLRDLLATFKSYLLHGFSQQPWGNPGCKRKRRWVFLLNAPCSYFQKLLATTQ